jgi:hypothetical protein
VDFKLLAENTPKDFSILQLMISNPSRVLSNYKILKKMHQQNITCTKYLYFKKWSSKDLSTSTQAYIINKKNIKPYIDSILRFDKYGVPIINIMNPNFNYYCRKKEEKSYCYLPIPITSDFYIYAGANFYAPVYEFLIPIFNGADVNSTIHPDHYNNHYHSFYAIDQVINKFSSSTSSSSGGKICTTNNNINGNNNNINKNNSYSRNDNINRINSTNDKVQSLLPFFVKNKNIFIDSVKKCKSKDWFVFYQCIIDN